MSSTLHKRRRSPSWSSSIEIRRLGQGKRKSVLDGGGLRWSPPPIVVGGGETLLISDFISHSQLEWLEREGEKKLSHLEPEIGSSSSAFSTSSSSSFHRTPLMGEECEFALSGEIFRDNDVRFGFWIATWEGHSRWTSLLVSYSSIMLRRKWCSDGLGMFFVDVLWYILRWGMSGFFDLWCRPTKGGGVLQRFNSTGKKKRQQCLFSYECKWHSLNVNESLFY